MEESDISSDEKPIYSQIQIYRPPPIRYTPMSIGVRKIVKFFAPTQNFVNIIANSIKMHGAVEIRRKNALQKGLFAVRTFKRSMILMPPIRTHAYVPKELKRYFGALRPNEMLFNPVRAKFGTLPPRRPADPRRRQRRKKREARRAARLGESLESSESEPEREAPERVFEHVTMCLDVSQAQPEFRAARRSCTPNSNLVYLQENQRFEFIMTASREIASGEEITLPHERDCTRSETPLRCACNSPRCFLELLRRNNLEIECEANGR
ncbi:unnamed protein product [Caenorhabditis auriculariae]|uniref:SET domain-containing protein n=1 Tax=Caenorhabditis auriculariae TaxID=2777116 RepID=A0A8S1H452_9PELO|nr:unnamed protein product [Caenorhabditis auriculariae]